MITRNDPYIAKLVYKPLHLERIFCITKKSTPTAEVYKNKGEINESITYIRRNFQNKHTSRALAAAAAFLWK